MTSCACCIAILAFAHVRLCKIAMQYAEIRPHLNDDHATWGEDRRKKHTPMMRVKIAAASGAPRKMSTLRATRQKPMWN